MKKNENIDVLFIYVSIYNNSLLNIVIFQRQTNSWNVEKNWKRMTYQILPFWEDFNIKKKIVCRIKKFLHFIAFQKFI